MDDKLIIINNPPPANWKFYFGDDRNVCFKAHLKNPPNAFHRWMMKVFLGIKWERITDDY